MFQHLFKPCGCTSTGIPPIPCIDGCEQTIDTDCIFYKHDNLTCLGILNGDNLTTVLQKLNAFCMYVKSSCACSQIICPQITNLVIT